VCVDKLFNIREREEAIATGIAAGVAVVVKRNRVSQLLALAFLQSVILFLLLAFSYLYFTGPSTSHHQYSPASLAFSHDTSSPPFLLRKQESGIILISNFFRVVFGWEKNTLVS
jgi:hypothetical protein